MATKESTPTAQCIEHGERLATLETQIVQLSGIEPRLRKLEIKIAVWAGGLGVLQCALVYWIKLK